MTGDVTSDGKDLSHFRAHELDRVFLAEGLRLFTALDPRPESEAIVTPYKDSVNIPLEQLAVRVYELPPSTETVYVYGGPEIQAECVELLNQMGRHAVPSFDFLSAETPTKGRLWRPNQSLEKLATTETAGKAVDLGCGSGRDAVYLASLGWEVLAFDVLPDALEIARKLASRYLLPGAGCLDFVCADVFGDSLPILVADLVYCCRFFDPRLPAIARRFLKPGGLFLAESFNEGHKARFGKPSANRVVPADSEKVFPRDKWEIVQEELTAEMRIVLARSKVHE